MQFEGKNLPINPFKLLKYFCIGRLPNKEITFTYAFMHRLFLRQSIFFNLMRFS